MKLSVIIPVYNVKSFLPNTIESVLTQSFEDFELILVDDGSTDGSGELCDRYETQDRRVRVVHQKNAGVSAARNAGVAAAQGDYIGFTDSDDIIEKDMYQCLMELAQRYDADVVQCEHDRQESLNGALRSENVECMDGAAFVRRIFTKTGGRYTNQVALWSKIYRRELFDGIEFPVGRTYEDEQETYKLCLKAKTLVETTDVLYHYIKRENSIITGISAKKMLDKQKALLDRLNYLPQYLPDLEKQCCETFLRYSQCTLCELYTAKEKAAQKAAAQLLYGQRKRLRPYLNRYDTLYLPLMKWTWTRAVVLKYGFEPLQRLWGIIKK